MGVSVKEAWTAPASRADFWAGVAARTAVVAGVFVALVLAALAWVYGHRLVRDPLDEGSFLALKARLVELKKAEPSDETKARFEATAVAIRAEDHRLRREYFWQRRFAARGAWLLLGGVAVFLAAAKTAATLRRKLPAPTLAEGGHDPEAMLGREGRWSAAGLGLALAAGAIALVVGVRPLLPAAWSPPGEQPGPQVAVTPPGPGETPLPVPPVGGKDGSGEPVKPTPAPATADLPTREEYLKNWPGFRGYTGSGVAAGDNWPLRWDVAKGEGIAWKSPVPLPGHASPVVWNDRLFLSGATKDKRGMFCYDTASGKLLWEREVPGAATATLKVNDETGFAAPTPVTDGRRVYVGFASGDHAAFDFAGNLVWTRALGPLKNQYGHATSPRLWRDRLLVQLDQGTTAEEGLSRLLALDAATGKTVWEVKRTVPNSWASPIVIEVNGQEQLVTLADPWLMAYRPEDGQELWRAHVMKGDVGPSPVFADGIVYASVEYRGTAAVKPDGRGDVSRTHVLWEEEGEAPDTCSPLTWAGQVVLLTTYGNLISARDARTGKVAWELEIQSPFMASPSVAGKHLYLFAMDGKAYVVEPGPAAAKVVFETDMAEKFTASPAFKDGRIYVRGQKELFCIGK